MIKIFFWNSALMAQKCEKSFFWKVIQEKKTLIKNSHWETLGPNEDDIFAIENLFQQLGIFYNCLHCKNRSYIFCDFLVKPWPNFLMILNFCWKHVALSVWSATYNSMSCEFVNQTIRFAMTYVTRGWLYKLTREVAWRTLHQPRPGSGPTPCPSPISLSRR